MLEASAALVKTIHEFLETNESDILKELLEGYWQLTGEEMNVEQKTAWKGVIPKLRRVLSKMNKNIVIVLEYRLPFGNERIDVTLLGRSTEDKPKAVILELKGWRNVKEIDTEIVKADGVIHQHPEIQILNYLGKLRFSHSAANLFEFVGAVWLYNLSENSLTFTDVKAFWDNYDDLAEFLLEEIPNPPKKEDVKAFINGYYKQSPHLLEAIKNNFESLKEGALKALCANGLGLSEEQHSIFAEILDDFLSNRKNICYIIRGRPGSGKSYLAILLLLRAIKDLLDDERDLKSVMKRQNIAVLGYRNNRLINTLRQVFSNIQQGLDAVLRFYSTGKGRGLAEGNPKSPHFKLVIYDEAQRMTKKQIEIAMQRGDITVFFYDDTQILNAEEEGWTDNFKAIANMLGINLKERELKGVYRVRGGEQYHKFVEQLLENPSEAKFPENISYDFRVFDDIRELLEELRNKAKQPNTRVALVASFTESPGDRKNKTAKSLNNRRIGFPLKSGFDHYKNIDVDIYWLMDEKKQYPKYWYEGESNKLTHCASIYGCQGFEADYVGVIWGRDFVYRNEKWELGENCEDDVGNPSLKSLFNKAKRGDSEARALALKLLVNRYRIFLTRGIYGTYIYCEDAETAKLLHSIVKKPHTNSDSFS